MIGGYQDSEIYVVDICCRDWFSFSPTCRGWESAVRRELDLNCHLSLQAPNNKVEFSIVGEGDAQQYFYIHPTKGDITLLKSVLKTKRSYYRVSLVMCTSLFNGLHVCAGVF